jgi:hypothetical protein
MSSPFSRRKKPKLLDQDIQYIDPIDCHSAVGYTIATTDWGGFKASVELANCDRKITWEFDCSNEDQLDRSRLKVANAIALLRCFEESFERHGQAFVDSKKRKKKK